jgi:hypothetical protein
MNSSQLIIGFADDRHVFQPGETLRAECSVDPPPVDEIVAIEWSAFWRTEGKGDEDGESIADEIDSASEGDRLDPNSLKPLEVGLPRSPLSYDGVILKIRWFVAAQVRLRGGETLDAEAEFRLGEVAPGSEVTA